MAPIAWLLLSLVILEARRVYGNLGGLNCSSDSQDDDSDISYYYLDVLNTISSDPSMVTNVKDLNSRQAPFVTGLDTSAPAYDFSGSGSGLYVSNAGISDSIRKTSCETNEFTMFASVYFKDGHTAGPVLTCTYLSNPLGSPVFGLYADALSDEVTVLYRHLGKSYAEVFPLRIVTGRWNKIAVYLSGKLLVLSVGCKEVARRVVPLPDYCADDSDLVLGLGGSASQEENDYGFYGILQHVGIAYGRGGMKYTCPDTPDTCPTCGQYLSIVKKTYELQQEADELKQKVAELERDVVDVSCNESSSTGASCLIDEKTFDDGMFFLDGTKICYCRAGNVDCAESNLCPSNSSTDSTRESTEAPTEGGQMCTRIPEIDRRLKVGEKAYKKEGDQCRVFECKDFQDFVAAMSSLHDCSDFPTCDHITYDNDDRMIATCCGSCDVCHFSSCPSNSTCVKSNENAMGYDCICDSGYERSTSEFNNEGFALCIDRDECALQTQQGGHSCPIEKADCINTPGSFICECHHGYNLTSDNLGVKICVDIDECLDVHTCQDHSKCVNEVPGYRCECFDNYYLSADGTECLPVCYPPCQNGGTCVAPHTCQCTRYYTGIFCERDINECNASTSSGGGGGRGRARAVGGANSGATDEKCEGQGLDCINTVGGFFCRCGAGFYWNGTNCTDVNECDSKIDNCISEAECINNIGSYACKCPDETDCTGACTRDGVMVKNHGKIVIGANQCRECTCLDGHMTCVKRDCDCSMVDSNRPYYQRCCPKCVQKNCEADDGTLVRPGVTWIDPSNRCKRCNCISKPGKPQFKCQDISESCPSVDYCPGEYLYTPQGMCCPVCELPQCDASNDGDVITLRNGCKTCTCKSSSWDCSQTVECPQLNCDPNHVIFLTDGNCCPFCEQNNEFFSSNTQCSA